MWDLIVSIPDHCLSFYFAECTDHFVGFVMPRIIVRSQNSKVLRSVWPCINDLVHRYVIVGKKYFMGLHCGFAFLHLLRPV